MKIVAGIIGGLILGVLGSILVAVAGAHWLEPTEAASGAPNLVSQWRMDEYSLKLTT